MSRPERLQNIIADAQIAPIQRLAALTPPAVAAPTFTPEAANRARELLIRQRKDDPRFKDPSKQKRRFVRLSSTTHKLADPSNWDFAPHEVARAFDTALSSLGDIAVAQALFNISGRTSISELWSDFHSPQEQEARLRRPVGGPVGWLLHAASSGSLEYVAFLARHMLSQESLDSALEIAYPRFLDVSRELLYHGASPNAHPSQFLDAVRRGDLQRMEMALAAPRTMELQYLTTAILEVSTTPATPDELHHRILCRLLAYGANGIAGDPEPFCSAISVRNFKNACALLSLATDSLANPALSSCDRTMPDVIRIEDSERRLLFLDLLLSAGAPSDSHVLQQHLFEAVKAQNLKEVSLLVNHGTPANRNGAESVQWSVKNNQMAVLQLVLPAGVSAENASSAVDQIQDALSEALTEQYVKFLCLHGAQGEPLGRLLVKAVHRNFLVLAKTLVDLGAPIDYDAASAVRLALQPYNAKMLQTLLRLDSDAEPALLGKALPAAMKIKTKDQRLEAVSALLLKGVSGIELDIALQMAVADITDTRDRRLIHELLEHHASVEYSNERGNCVHMAVAQGDLAVLKLLCREIRSGEILSNAVPFIIQPLKDGKNYDDIRSILTILLKQVTPDDRLSETLIPLVSLDKQLLLIKAFLAHKVDVNYKDGKAVQEAVNLPSPFALRLICEQRQLTPPVLARLIPILLHEHRNYSQEKVILLFGQAKEHSWILDNALIDERLTLRAHHLDIVKHLLENGANVDTAQGVVLTRAAGSGNTNLTTLLITGKPCQSSLKAALLEAMKLKDWDVRYRIIQVLFTSPHTDLGQDPALVAECNYGGASDPRIIQLLLEKGASPDYESGKALQIAAMKGPGELLKLLLAADPAQVTIDAAFLVAKEEVVHILLDHGANVNTGFGEAFMRAAKVNDKALFSKMLKYNADLGLVITKLMESVTDEERLIEFLRLCLEAGGGDFVAMNGGLLISSMKSFPRSFELLRLLLTHGCPAGDLLDMDGEEKVTPLIWALLQPQKRISDAVLLELLSGDQEARPKYITVGSRASAIVKASEDGRRDVVSRLVDLKVDISVTDGDGHSPLFHASKRGDFRTVQLLVNASADINDGSLHEAARNLHSDIAKLLLDYDHSAEYPSELHGGRVPLAELCLFAEISDPESASRAREIMKLLFRVTDLSWNQDGKSILHLALDNSNNTYEITQAVLHFDQIWKGAHTGETMLYQDPRTKLIYSPTKYVEHFYTGSDAMKARLIRLLETKGFRKPRFYSPIGKQPPGFCGVPAEIKTEIERAQRADFELREQIRREQEAYEERQRLAEHEHRERLRRSREVDEQRHRQAEVDKVEAIRRSHELEEAARRQQQARHGQEVAQMREKSAVALQLQTAQAEAAARQRSLEADQQRRITDVRNDEDRKHRERLLLMEQKADEGRVKTERKLIEDKESAMKREHERQMHLLNRQDESVRRKAAELRSLGMNSAGRQIGWEGSVD